MNAELIAKKLKRIEKVMNIVNDEFAALDAELTKIKENIQVTEDRLEKEKTKKYKTSNSVKYIQQLEAILELEQLRRKRHEAKLTKLLEQESNLHIKKEKLQFQLHPRELSYLNQEVFSTINLENNSIENFYNKAGQNEQAKSLPFLQSPPKNVSKQHTKFDYSENNFGTPAPFFPTISNMFSSNRSHKNKTQGGKRKRRQTRKSK